MFGASPSRSRRECQFPTWKLSPKLTIKLAAALAVFGRVDFHRLLLRTARLDDAGVVLVRTPLLQERCGSETAAFRNCFSRPPRIGEPYQVRAHAAFTTDDDPIGRATFTV